PTTTPGRRAGHRTGRRWRWAESSRTASKRTCCSWSTRPAAIAASWAVGTIVRTSSAGCRTIARSPASPVGGFESSTLTAGSSDASLNSIDCSPSGDRFVADDDAGAVEVVSSAGTVLTTLSKEGAFPRWSPDGKRILFLENGLERDAIVITDPTGKNRRVLV